jgi:hypothetical protein
MSLPVETPGDDGSHRVKIERKNVVLVSAALPSRPDPDGKEERTPT